MDVELLVDIPDMSPYGIDTDEAGICNEFVAHPFDKARKDFFFAVGEIESISLWSR